MKETDNISETKALKPKIRLDEVTLMRTILALLIVFMHSFTCYQGKLDAIIISCVFFASF